MKLTGDFNKGDGVYKEPALDYTEYEIIIIHPDKNNEQERQKPGSGGLIWVADIFPIGSLATIPQPICVLVSRSQSTSMNRMDTTSCGDIWMA